MQYRNSTYASGAWDTYLYEKNLQGDIVAVYNTSGTKLVSYTYDPWGRILGTTYHNGGASTSAVHNPMRYRGYYYDTDLYLYYLATRYYDPEVRRFVTQDSALYHNMLGYNMYAYCNNNPVNYVDNTGESPEAFLAGWTSIMGIIASIEPTVIGEIVLVIGIGVILAINADPISYDDILFNDRVIPRSIGQESSILTLDTYETTKIDEYDPNPYRRPGEKSKIAKIGQRLELNKDGNLEIIRETENRQSLNLTRHQKRDIKNILFLHLHWKEMVELRCDNECLAMQKMGKIL